MKPDKAGRRPGVVDLMEKDDGYVVGALMALYQQQTESERVSHSTHLYNGRGFNAIDAPILTSFAEFYQKRGFLTPKQIIAARSILFKYRNQLENLGIECLSIKKEKLHKSSSSREYKWAGLTDGGKRIRIKFSFPRRDPRFSETLRRVKTLFGRRWCRETESWVCPLNLDSVERLIDWGFELGDNLKEWYQKSTYTPDEEEVKKLEIPGLRKNLFPFQKAGVAFIEAKQGRVLIGDEMGLGKTAQALAWLQFHPTYRPTVVVCPASVKLNWAREAKMWMEDVNPILLYGRDPKLPLESRERKSLLIINYDILTYWEEELIKLNPQVVIFDEVHYTKNKSSKRTKSSKKLAKKAKYVIALSGTPIINRPVEFFNCLNFLRPDLWPSFWNFVQTYCGAIHNGYGWDFTGATNTEELHEKLTKTIMIRRTKKEVLKDLPSKVRAVIPVEIDNRLDYSRAETEFEEWVVENFGEKKLSTMATAPALTKIEALKQLAVQGKMKSVIEWIHDFLDSGKKLVVFATHYFTIDTLMDEFYPIAVKLDGRDSQQKKQEAIDTFQSDPDIRLFIGNIKAAGVGITLTAASDVAFVELGWTPGEHDQAEDRVHRIGQEDSVVAWYLIANGTIEEKVAELIDQKREILDQVLDGKMTDESSLLVELLNSFLQKSPYNK